MANRVDRISLVVHPRVALFLQEAGKNYTPYADAPVDDESVLVMPSSLDRYISIFGDEVVTFSQLEHPVLRHKRRGKPQRCFIKLCRVTLKPEIKRATQTSN